MELISLLTGQPAAVALAILAVYWLNRNTLEFAREKREIIELLRAERKEWQEQSREERRELMDIQRASVEAEKQVAHELHALRNQLAPTLPLLQQLMAKFGGETPRGVKGRNPDGTD